jgi:hypothetical protein
LRTDLVSIPGGVVKMVTFGSTAKRNCRTKT